MFTDDRDLFEKTIVDGTPDQFKRKDSGEYVKSHIESAWRHYCEFTRAYRHMVVIEDEKSREILELKQQIEDLKNKKFARFANEECWIFQKDGDNGLDTLLCPVAISAKDLLEICQKANIKS